MAVRKKEGRLAFFPKQKLWVLDAEPHVVDFFSRIFPRAGLHNRPGDDGLDRYTHRPRSINDGIDTRRDLDWFSTRYQLDISADDLSVLKDGTKTYESLLTEQEEALTNYSPPAIELALPLRDYQQAAYSLFKKKKRLLLADQVGLGKTPVAIASGGGELPTLVVVPTFLVHQWKDEITKFLPKARVHLIFGRKAYDLPEADFYVTAYSRIASWADYFGPKAKKIGCLILDEVHELRNGSTQKSLSVKSVADHTPQVLGLSATPIMNYGSDIYNIFQIIDPDRLGRKEDFQREWCTMAGIRDPKLFGNFLRKNFMMLRRTREDINAVMEKVNRVVYNVEADIESLKKLEKEASVLALQVLTGDFKSSGAAARELDWKLRQATGVAKARSCCEVIKMLVESGEKVTAFAWHKDVYAIMAQELSQYKPVFFTGSESEKEKRKSLDAFINGDSQVFVMSLRSGAGINGLQNVSSYAVFCELDWSPGVTEQAIGRLWRDGQKSQVNALFVTISDGSDPILIKVLGLKSSEARSIMSGGDKMNEKKEDESVFLKSVTDEEDGEKGMSRLKTLASEYLNKRGLTIPERPEAAKDSGAVFTDENSFYNFIDAPHEDTLSGQLLKRLNKSTLSIHDELTMQDEIEKFFKKDGLSYAREFVASKQNRYDFLVKRQSKDSTEMVVVETKVHGAKKKDTLRQLTRYALDAKTSGKELTAIILVSPWNLKHFSLPDGTQVYCVNASTAAFIGGSLS